MAVRQTTIPERSVLFTGGHVYDYTDCFEGEFVDREGKIGPPEVCISFFTSEPVWVKRFFQLRNSIVGKLGLKTPGEITNRNSLLENFKCEPGEKIGLFQVLDRTANEVVLGENDKHLDFRISLYVDEHSEDPEKKKLLIATTVNFHNRWGLLYFLPVKPFHKLVVPVMLKGTIRNINMNLEAL